MGEKIAGAILLVGAGILYTLYSTGCMDWSLTEPHPTITEIGVEKLPDSVRITLERCAPGAEIVRVEAWKYKGKITQYDVTVLSTGGEKTYGLFPDGRYSPLTEERERAEKSGVWRKVEIDLGQLDAAGFRGPPGGKISISYEFAIPNTTACKSEVKAIDQTVKFMPGSRGRIEATDQQCLCIGSTHQKAYRQTLRQLAELPYIERIIECYFE
jgi:hypothetical protein